ncbi:heterokaryon incompatibility protein-domain-containing protein [Trametes meyenii]|nr:heterokaryon incompatibility protein-domain-containing protein [Trametes meyenii]
MYLLDTTTGALELVDDPRKERYAILSHVWQREGEQSFQDIQVLQHGLVRRVSSALKGRRNGPVSILPRTSAKIRNCCEYVRRRGYKKVWIDTCCIDKTSSSELSEAINSMYEWYGLADVCFAFLCDVTDQADPEKQNSAFCRSIWFQRGWTLQELIAPRSLVFVSKEWRFIGTKANLAHVIEKVTGIPTGILTHELSLNSVSIARRMSWASRRVTKRPEDEAYSLMGIFGVKMSTIYGEGRTAFLRLQEEILKHIHDESIFAWGSIFRVSSPGSSLRWRQEWKDGFDPSVLFARSPAEFFYSGNIEPVALNDFEQRLGIPMAVPHYTITSYGVRSSFPSIMIRQTPTSSIRLAVLACQAKPRKQTTEREKLVALLLTQQPNSSLQSGRYIVGALGSEMPSWLLDDPDSPSSTSTSSSTAKSDQYSQSTSESSSRSRSTTTSVTTLTNEMVYRAVVLPWSEHRDSALFYNPTRAGVAHTAGNGGMTGA